MPDIETLTIKRLLSEDSYRVPIYQRNYDWGEKQVLQLIADIEDYAKDPTKSDHNYYLGAIVVYPRTEGSRSYFETVDGQQRLITLTILLNVLKQKGVQDEEDWKWYYKPNVKFEHRDRDNEAIIMMADGRELMKGYENTTNIWAVYRMIDRAVERLIENYEKFLKFFLDKVLVIRVPIPKGTNLNHYFEIMNSRGEQLEKHEILKARLMDLLDEKNDDERRLFNEIWEACSNMNKYVQMNMKVKLREIIFTESWDNYQNKDFDTLLSDILSHNVQGHEQQEQQEQEEQQQEEEQQSKAQGPTIRSIEKLFEDACKHVDYPLPNDENEQSGNGQDRFGSVIGFPNFLLQALKVMYHNEKKDDPEYDNKYKDIDQGIKLDDKRLIEIFDTVVKSYLVDNEKCEFAKRFIIDLLKLRYLFDRYVIKREHVGDRENWSLERLKKSNSNTYYVNTFSDEDNDSENEPIKIIRELEAKIRMLEAMFHVSAPTQIYKYWLNAVLNYVYTNDQIKADGLHDMLYQLACTYMLDRYLCKDNGSNDNDKVEFEIIIYKYDCVAQNHTIHWKNIDNGCGVENFVFNFYDYITWKDSGNKYQDFEFTYRTSVEHFYPQHPMDGNQWLNEDVLHLFGNLCLISNSMNSKFNNNMPKAKVANFENDKNVKQQSIKLREMIQKTKDGHQWGETEIKEFENEARNKLLKALKKVSEYLEEYIVAKPVEDEASDVDPEMQE